MGQEHHKAPPSLLRDPAPETGVTISIACSGPQDVNYFIGGHGRNHETERPNS